jgi:CheY-like chemotaxis protein
VLLIDRDRDTRRLYAEYLELGHWTIDEADDGALGLAKALARPPHVIVMEMRLPGISGYELCRILKRDLVTRAIPIVVVTADAYPADVQRAKAAGADAVLTKPCLPDALAAELRQQLQRRHDRQQQTADAGGMPPASPSPDTAPRGEPPRARALSRAHQRHDTTAPPVNPPVLICPECDQPLTYRRSHVGGVSARHPEQWDYFSCPAGCGTFQYRTRTRKLRKVH